MVKAPSLPWDGALKKKPGQHLLHGRFLANARAEVREVPEILSNEFCR
jgi:hypothetical protein